MQYFLGIAGYVAKVPFDQSIMVHFRKRFSDDDIRRINELVVQRGKDMLLKALAECSVITSKMVANRMIAAASWR